MDLPRLPSLLLLNHRSDLIHFSRHPCFSYNKEQYKLFKKEVKTIAQKNGAHFINLENLVPADYWGTKNTTTLGEKQELDFMHFQSKGHQLLAERLYIELQLLWKKPNNNDF